MATHAPYLPRTKTQLIREIRSFRPGWPEHDGRAWPAWFYAGTLYTWNDLVGVLADFGFDCTDLWRAPGAIVKQPARSRAAETVSYWTQIALHMACVGAIAGVLIGTLLVAMLGPVLLVWRWLH